MKIGSHEIKFVALSTPVEEHLQILSVCMNLMFTICGVTIGPLILLLVLFTRFWFLALLYFIWIVYDRKTGYEGGRKWNWIRRWKMYKLYRDYFPVKLIKTADLPSDKNYFLISYPHGVLPFSVVANFGSEANNVESEVFPGLDFRFITLDVNFITPFTREYFLALGGCGSSESSIRYLLNDKSSAKGVVLLPGGASESIWARAGPTYTIITSRRKGFIRIALSTGTTLVPVFSFGENNVYNGQVRNKWLSRIQDVVSKYAGFIPIVPRGRTVCTTNCGILPNSAKINTVVGKPIDVPKVENPSKELIDEYHKKFFDALKELFEEYKEKYDEAGSSATLVMI